MATPGRLIDLMDQRQTNFSAVQFLVLDEADRMLDMGFLPPIRQIVRALPQKRQTLMFSASLSREIEALTHEFQQSPKVIEIGRRANPAETVTQLVYEVQMHQKPALLLHLLNDQNFDTVLVFTRTKHGADRVARQLESSGIKTGTIHSNRSQNQRLRALKDFKSGAVRVLVATDIAARGIDVDGISHVVNYDFPMHSEDYVHRIGRTGRAHAVGDAISFVTPEDQGPLRSLERFIGRGIVRKRAEGFDYEAPAPPRTDRGPRPPRPHDNRRGPAPRGRSGGGGRTSRSMKPEQELARRDPKLAALIAQVGPFPIVPEKIVRPLDALARSIAYQQLSGKAAATIFGRVKALYPGRKWFSAEQLMATPDETFRAAGLSRAKTAAFKDLAAKTLDGTVPKPAALARMSDDEIIARLTIRARHRSLDG